mgnify:CR=1 FL=1
MCRLCFPYVVLLSLDSLSLLSRHGWTSYVSEPIARPGTSSCQRPTLAHSGLRSWCQIMTGQQPIELVGPLAKTFLLHRMTAREELGRLFELTVDCLSKDFDVRPTKNLTTDGPSFDVLGQPMTVRVELPRGGWRYFDGHVCRFECLGVTASRRYARYRMVLRPWLWFLTRSADCRIFQDRAVPDILKEVFREHGFSDFQEELYGEYRRWEY